MIDWTDPASKISKYFSVREALFLPQWNRLATEADGLDDHAKAQIVRFAVEVMDRVRDLVGHPIVVHCWFRPGAYNSLKQIGGKPGSAHQCLGDWSAADWHASMPGAETQGHSCDMLRDMLNPKLEELGARMENNGHGAAWVHLDNHPVGHARYFRA